MENRPFWPIMTRPICVKRKEGGNVRKRISKITQRQRQRNRRGEIGREEREIERERDRQTDRQTEKDKERIQRLQKTLFACAILMMVCRASLRKKRPSPPMTRNLPVWVCIFIENRKILKKGKIMKTKTKTKTWKKDKDIINDNIVTPLPHTKKKKRKKERKKERNCTQNIKSTQI